MNNLPTGTVTFLFTDIEGSTRLLQTLRDEFADALAEHRAILRNAFAQWNGVEVDTQGDSFFVAFARATDAVNAVVDAQRALSAQKFPRDAAIRVRMGLHTGEPQVSDAHYVGMDVHRAARIMSAAHGGQVLLSQTTFDLIENELPDGVTLRDLGEHRLKDLRRPKHLYQLVIAGLENDFPPIKTLDALPNNLPIQLTSFVGRDQEIGELETILARQRLVTLTGVGGTGKTRLALQVAADVLDEYKDGVWLIELAPLSDPALVPQTVAITLGLREQTGRAFIEMLQDYLRNKHLLLLLDNCEHLIEACAELADTLLHAAPHLKILATSREALGIAGETSYPVRSLSLPDTKHLQIENFSQYDAVHLFIDRAVSVQPNFQVTNENAPAVAQICARLDGIPLAIELAAARVKGLSVEQIASRLDDRFRLLTGGSRTALPRQRTLQAAIDWSYKLLSEQERVLLRRLSVFAGGWTVETAEAVCSDDERRPTNDESEIRPSTFVLRPDDILDLLLRLVDKSLVVAETETSELRYHMLETIRQYAQEKLEEADANEKLRERHLDFFLALAETAEPRIRSGEMLHWINRLEADQANLRSALECSVKQDPEKGLRLGIALRRYWLMRNLATEGQQFLRPLLSHPEMQQPTRTRALGLIALAGFMGPSSGIRRPFSLEALNIGEKLTDPEVIARALLLHASISQTENLSEAFEACERGTRLFRVLEDKWHLAAMLRTHAIAAIRSGQHDLASQLLEESLVLSKESGDPTAVAGVLSTLSYEYTYRHDLSQARSYLNQEITLTRNLQAKQWLSGSLNQMGEIARMEGNYAEARRLYEEANSLREQIGYPPNPGILGNLGYVALYFQEFGLAESYFRNQLPLLVSQHQIKEAPCSLLGLATVALAEQSFERAACLAGAAIELKNQTSVPLEPADEIEFKRTFERIQSQLGSLDLDEAWAKGRALTLEQAIALALEDKENDENRITNNK